MRRFTSLLMAASLLLMLAGLVGLAVSVWPSWTARLAAREEAAELPAATLTPFLPAGPTRAAAAQGKPVQAAAALPAAELAPTALPDGHFARWLMEFPQDTVRLNIIPGPQFNGGQAVSLAFLPGQECEFGAGRACVSRHRGGQVILLTIHSGVGGQSERLRSALEGSGLDEAAYPIEQIRANMAALQGAEVQMGLGEDTLATLELAALARVPSMDIQRYFDLPFDDALEMVAVENDPVRAVLDTGEPLLAFEICGWHLPGEVWGIGSSPTTASIYLGFIRLRAP